MKKLGVVAGAAGVLIALVGLAAGPDTKSGDEPDGPAAGIPNAVGKLQLTLPSFVRMYVRQNPALRAMGIDYVQADAPERFYDGRYALRLNGQSGWTHGTSEDITVGEVYMEHGQVLNFSNLLTGGKSNTNEVSPSTRTRVNTRSRNWDVALSKMFSTGTTVIAGVTSRTTEVNTEVLSTTSDRDLLNNVDAATYTEDYYRTARSARSRTLTAQHGRGTYMGRSYRTVQPTVFLTLRQTLLRNMFGTKDRLDRNILRTETAMSREKLESGIAQAVSGAIMAFWDLEVKRLNVDVARQSHESLLSVRRLTGRKVYLGLAEHYDLNLYNSRVASTQSAVEQAELAYVQSIRKVVRLLDVPAGTPIAHHHSLTRDPIKPTYEQLVAVALEKRAEIRNQKREVSLAELRLESARQELLPSVIMSAGVAGSAQDSRESEAMRLARNGKNPSYQMGVEFSMPLWDENVLVAARYADLNRKKAAIEMERIRREITEDVKNKYENAKLAHMQLSRAGTAMREAQLYYRGLLNQAANGRVDVAVINVALDTYLNALRADQGSLVAYNAALLELALAQNAVFEKFGIDLSAMPGEGAND